MPFISRSLFLWALLAFPALLPAQKKIAPAGKLTPQAITLLHASEDTLAILSFAVVNDSMPEIRFLACRSLITALVHALKTENSFRYTFDRLKGVSILAPPDSSFRLFTWQLFVNDSTHRYYGAIQMNQREMKLFPLIDRSFEMPGIPVAEQMPPDRWYGALYYNIRPFDTRKGRKYLLFGYDGFTFFEKRKVLDVLSFARDGTPVFGAPVFERPDGSATEQRLILEYTSEARVRLNWDEQYQMILLDHLIPHPNPSTGGMMNIPDGSYDGLKLVKGRWKFVEKVFNDVMKEAPRPEPVLDAEKGKNILGTTGRPRKGKN
jgi:hypothetical protein